MSATPQSLVGRDVYARDGSKAGQGREAIFDGEYLVVRRSIFSGMVVPAGILTESGARLTLPFTSSYLANAPQVDAKHGLSARDKGALDSFFMWKAA